MSDLKATIYGLKHRIKSLAGIPYRSLVKNSWKMTTEDFWSYQTKRFRDIYSFSTERVPYYRALKNTYIPLSKCDNSILSILSQFPILKKETVRSQNSDFWASPMSPFVKFSSTSGTSGTPLRLPITPEEKGYFQAICEEYKFTICGSRNPKSLFLDGIITPPSSSEELYWLDRFSGNVYLSIHSFKSTNQHKFSEIINKINPQIFWGYPSAVHNLSKILNNQQCSDKDSRVAIVTSEVLQPALVPLAVRATSIVYRELECISHR